MSKLDLGYVREGVVEIDPMTGRFVLRCEGEDGFEYFDPQEVLEAYKGQEIRIVVAPFSTITKLSEMVASGELPLDQVPNAGGR